MLETRGRRERWLVVREGGGGGGGGDAGVKLVRVCVAWMLVTWILCKLNWHNLFFCVLETRGRRERWLVVRGRYWD